MAEQWNDDVEKRLRESVDGYREGDTVEDQLLPCADVAAALAELDARAKEIEQIKEGRETWHTAWRTEIDKLLTERNQARAELDRRGAEIERLRGERDFFKRKMEERAMAMPDAEEILRLRASLASVSGALADAGDIPVPEDESKLGDAVRALASEINKLKASKASAHAHMHRERARAANIRAEMAPILAKLKAQGSVFSEIKRSLFYARREADELRAQLAALGRGTAAQTDEYTRAAVEFAEAEKAVIDECGGRNRYGVLCELSRARDAARDRFHAAQAARAGFLCSRCGKATDSTRQADDSDRPVCAACAQVARGKPTIPLNQQDAPPAAQEPRWMGDAQLSSWWTCSKCGAVHSGWSKLEHERSCWRAPAPRAEASELVEAIERLSQWTSARLYSASSDECSQVMRDIFAVVAAHRAREKEHVHSETKAPPAADTVDGGFDSRLRNDSAESAPGPGVSGAGHSHPAARAEASEMVRIAHALLGCGSSPSEGVPCPVEHGHFTVETLLNSIKELQRCERELIDYQNALDPERTIVNETTGISYYDILNDALAAQRRAPPPAGEIAPEERRLCEALSDPHAQWMMDWRDGAFEQSVNPTAARRVVHALKALYAAWAKRRAGEGAK